MSDASTAPPDTKSPIPWRSVPRPPADAPIHPAATLFPSLSVAARAELRADIASNGVIEPIYVDPKGRLLDGRHGIRRRRHYKFLPTKESADDFLAAAIVMSRQPTQADLPSTMTVAGYAEHWLRLAASHLKPRTLTCYRDTLRLHLLPTFGATRVRDLQRGRLKAFLAERSRTDSSPPTSPTSSGAV
jgi:Phage integrase, N-terminal SAM-like domain